MKLTLRLAGLACASLLLSAAGASAGPKIVSGPGANPGCFKPWSAQTKFFQWDKKPGPYKIALVNGFVGNTWRIQMIKTAKAFAEEPDIKKNIKEFKVVSTGTDVAAQLGAMEDFINQGIDAIVTIETLEHVADLQGVALEVARVLRQGGELIITVPNRLYPIEGHGGTVFGRHYSRLPLITWVPWLHSRVGSARVFTVGSLDRLFVPLGFRRRAV